MQQKFSKKQLEHSFLVYQNAKNKNLSGVPQELKKNNLRLNEDKCKFSKIEVKFYFHIFSSSGLKPNPKKVETIHKARPPQNLSEVKFLLGMAQYVSRFISNYTTITTPLPLLTRQDTPWKSEEEEQKAFNELKEAFVKD